MLVCFDETLGTTAENLALDEALLLAAEAGTSPEVLRFGEQTKYAVVVGAGGSVEHDVDVEACERDGVSIHRRASGGGTVVLGPGCLTYSVVLSFDRAAELGQVSSSYRWILGRMRSALSTFGMVEICGISDLVVDGRKFSGNAQQRKARHVLHHGTVLYRFDLPRLERYLRAPEREPAYRSGRAHREFVGNIDAEPTLIRTAIATAFEATPGDVPEVAMAMVPDLVANRYAQREWNFRR